MNPIYAQIRENYGWTLFQKKSINFWFAGYLTNNKTVEDLIKDLIDFQQSNQINIIVLSNWVKTLSGHFAFVVESDEDWCFSAVDRVCSIPLFEKKTSEGYLFSNCASYLKEENLNINQNSLLEISMSGFTLGRRTLYNDLSRFLAGECSLFVKGKLHRDYYYSYLPQPIISDEEVLINKLTSALLIALNKTIKDVYGRQIVVPLSAGNDSRLIASGFRELGYENVTCFSYGRKGNYEVKTSQEVAKRLKYKWIFIEDKLKSKREFFLSEIYRKYVEDFESFSSVPNIQDVYEIYELKKLGVIDKDALIINGNTGDFISGGHIPSDLEINKSTSSINNFCWDSFLEKHYSIWRKLRSEYNDKIIIDGLKQLFSLRFDASINNELNDYSVIESMELIGRQSRYVMNQQRAYEFFGYEWRLPLWDVDLLDFWKKVPPEYKINQKLYKKTLIENNWGDVWLDIKVNNKKVRPYSLFFIRAALKAIISPLGKKKWHALEKNIFVYWMHPSYARAVESYKNVLLDNRGQRNTISWLADQYVKKIGYRGIIDASRLGKNKNIK
jgi:asparagine synthase (glutamine-hydrolysing)